MYDCVTRLKDKPRPLVGCCDSGYIFFIMTHVNTNKKTIYVGGLAEDVDEKMVKAALIPFGEITEVQIPLDYQTSKHRGFAFVEFESSQQASVALTGLQGFKITQDDAIIVSFAKK